PLGQWRHAAAFHRIVARGTSVARDRAPQLPMPHRRADRAEPYPSAGPSTVVRRFHAPASTGTVTAHIPERPRPWTWADRWPACRPASLHRLMVQAVPRWISARMFYSY